MAQLTKTQGTSLVAWQDIATGNVAAGSAQNVASLLAAAVFIHLGRRSGTAFTSGWPNARVEASAKSSGNDQWFVLAQFQMLIGASIANTTLNGAISAGATSFVVTAATNIASGDLVFLGHTTDVTKYELVRVKSVSGTTVTPEEAVANAHDNGAPVTDQAELYMAQLDLSAIGRIRVVIDNANSGQSVAAEATMVTGDSIG